VNFNQVVEKSSPFAIAGTFDDPGLTDTWTGTISFGDGNVIPLNIVGETFRTSYVYNRYGAFDGVVTIRDDDGSEGHFKFVAVVVPPSGLQAGDFDSDGQYTCADVNMLTAQIAVHGTNTRFDITQDRLVDQSDLRLWLGLAGVVASPRGVPFSLGDANLDGTVDTADLDVWKSHLFSGQSGWCNGDFNADGFIDAADFNVWNVNRSTEPATALGDLNADGSVDAADAGAMFGNWGGSGTGDLNSDGIVDAADAGMLFGNWTGDGAPLSMTNAYNVEVKHDDVVNSLATAIVKEKDTRRTANTALNDIALELFLEE